MFVESLSKKYCAGYCLNKILKDKYEEGCFIPFHETMIVGEYSLPLFSKKFIK